jgi:hypothetical protein
MSIQDRTFRSLCRCAAAGALSLLALLGPGRITPARAADNALLDQMWGVKAAALTASDVALPEPAPRAGQLDVVNSISPFPFAVRLGAMISPRLAFLGGVDVLLRGINPAPGWDLRVDGEVIVDANVNDVSTLFPVTLDIIYNKSLLAGSKFYAGAGIGPYFGDVTRFGGKLLVGFSLTSNLAAEAELHYPGDSELPLTVMLRLGL